MATVLITGANRGIGLELARRFKERGDSVVAVCRQASDDLRALDVRVEEGVDVTDDTLGGLHDRLEKSSIDVLVNNAGLLSMESFPELDFDSIRRQFEVNALGPLKVTVGLHDRLRDGGKVALITSRMGSIGDNTSGGAYGYRMSKAALNIAGVSLAHDLRRRKIAVAILHPGFVRTDMTRQSGNVDPSESARQLVERIDALDLESSGTFWHAKGEELPW